MKPNSPTPQLPDHDPGLEDDTLWTLLDQGSTSGPSPSFVQDTLRRARLEEAPLPWWKSLTTRRIRTASLATFGTAAAVIALVISLPSDPVPVEQTTSTQATAPAQWTELENALASQVLTEAAENPAQFSDQEIVALLY
ncbi:hypothetical protein V2O64_21580 [Verrucomicrobiaceae bacterium 227]